MCSLESFAEQTSARASVELSDKVAFANRAHGEILHVLCNFAILQVIQFDDDFFSHEKFPPVIREDLKRADHSESVRYPR